MDSFVIRAEYEEHNRRMEDEHVRLNKRVSKIEQALEENNKLLIAVERLASSMEVMQKEQKEQGERILKIAYGFNVCHYCCSWNFFGVRFKTNRDFLGGIRMFKNTVFKASVNTVEWLKKAGIRAIKTFAQTMASMITIGAAVNEVAGVPEVKSE